MELREGIERVLLGESLRRVAVAHREELIAALGLDVETVAGSEFWDDTRRFMNRLCRDLGDRHAGDSRVATALADWARRVEDYEAFDSLLANFRDFVGRDQLVRRGRHLFPGPLTAHWEDEA